MDHKLSLGCWLLFLLCRYVRSQGAACIGQQTGLYRGPRLTDSGTTHILELNAFYEVPCCGVISQWDVDIARPMAITYTLQMQVFRDTASADTFTFVGGNEFTITMDGDQPLTPAVNDRISVQAMDRIGWSEPLIAYKGNGNEEDDVYKYTDPGALTAGDTISIAGVTESTDHTYRLMFTTEPGASPTVDAGFPITVYNNQSSGMVTSITWADADIGDTVTIAETTGDSQFTFDTTTGEVTLIGVTQVNGTVSMTYTATDACGLTGTDTLVVTIENPAPWFDGPFSATISESETLLTSLFTLTVYDPGDPNLSCVMEPTLTQFSLLPNGTHTNIVSNADPQFNRTETSTHTITIVCYDGSTYVSQDYLVYVLPNANPVIQNLQNSTIINSTHGSTVVFQVLATDAENDNLAYHLYCEDTVNPCLFSIGHDGNVYLNNVSLVNTTQPFYNVFINVTDYYGASQTWTLTINVADLNSAVTITGLPITISVNENNVVNVSIYDVSYIDIDTGQSHTWTFTSNPASSYFDVLDNGTVILLESIDYEALPSTTYELPITVSDGVTSDSGNLTVVFQNVNEQPEFAQSLYGLSAVEAVAGTSLGTPLWGITDPDAGDTYTLRMGCATYAEYFAMDSSTGEITLQLEYDIDAGLPTTITCPVNVTDAGGLYSTTNITITFTDINDNTPACSAPAYFFYPSWYTSAGTSLGTVTATDGDTGVFGVLTYSLDQTSLGVQQFAIDSSGLITFLIAPTSGSSGLNYTQRHDILVYATDTGGLVATCSVAVIVGDTTTASLTTTTWRYKKFWEWGPNVAWFSLLMLLLLGILVFASWLCCTCKGPLGCRSFLRRLRGRCRGGPRQYNKPMHRHQKGYGGRGSVRNPPPAAHSWAKQHKMKVAFIRVPKPGGVVHP